MSVPIFCYFFVSEKLLGEVSQNHLKNYVNYFQEKTKTEPGGDLQEGPIAPRRHPGAAQPLATPGSHLGDFVASSSRPLDYKLSSTRKPSILGHIFQKISEAAAVAKPRSGAAYHDQDHIICNCYMMCLHGSDELWKSLFLFIYVLCFIYDLASSPMLVDALAK